MSKKLKKVALWNVLVGRLESLHASKEDAEGAAERFVAKSGANSDSTELEIVEFSVMAPPEEEKEEPEKFSKKSGSKKGD